MKKREDYVSGEHGNKKRHYVGSGGPAQIISESGDVYNIPEHELKPLKPARRSPKPKRGLKLKPNLYMLKLNLLYPDGSPETDRILNELVTNPRRYRKGDADISH
jgi:hypothetical protein